MDTIYIENAVTDDDRAKDIIRRFPKARIIHIDRYTEVFNPKAQNFRAQKKNPALILASRHGNLVLPAPPDYNIGGEHNYYFSHMMNCIYDCRYCFLQGMYASANYVVFVNYDEFFSAIESTAQQHSSPSWFFSGYDCDSLALEPITHFVDETLNFFSRTPSAFLELRTKSTQIRSLLRHAPLPNCVVAYSFTPTAIQQALEHKTPSVEKRIQALEQLQSLGWKIGLRFDPLIKAGNFKEIYGDMFNDIFNRLDRESIHSVSLGPFRLPRPFFKRLITLYPDEPMLSERFENKGNMVSYPEQEEADMIGWCSEQILNRVSERQFFPCVE